MAEFDSITEPIEVPGLTDEQVKKATAVVNTHCKEDTDEMLDALGILPPKLPEEIPEEERKRDFTDVEIHKMVAMRLSGSPLYQIARLFLIQPYEVKDCLKQFTDYYAKIKVTDGMI